MSLVVLPFKDEPASLIARNAGVALAHPRIDEVWAVASPGGPPNGLIEALASLSSATSKRARILEQDRIGTLRAGKGDGMNTAFALAAESDWERVHFYDADITNFDHGWIEGAEEAADRGYGVVRHRFPRAATDAMITWFITRPGLAFAFPGTLLPRLDQPLGGEFLVTGPAVKALASSQEVRARSDWGIDTLITYETAVMDLGVYEHHVADGKRHSLYGSLAELEDMALECLDAVIQVGSRSPPLSDARHGADEPGAVPNDLKETIGYDRDTTAGLLDRPAPPESQAHALLLPLPREEAAEDEKRWEVTLRHLIANFDLADPGWRDLAFRLWVRRVLAYTRDVVPLGYDRAISYLRATIDRYEKSG